MHTQTDEDLYRLEQRALNRYFSGLNESQRRAVFHVNGPLLILAGAGSGKTTVLISRVENMIRFGDCYECGDDFAPDERAVSILREYLDGKNVAPEALGELLARNPVKPWNILAITFTNKAAGELRSRLEAALGSVALDVNACTFHSLCARILRVDGEAIGYDRSFTIYDADDSLRVIRDAIKQAGLDEKMFPARSVASAIGRAKDMLGTPDEMLATAGDYREQCIAKIWAVYEKVLKAANALDFDGLIVETVRLFRRNPDILDKYRRRYRYVMVDEYQDTNHAQYELVSLLCAQHENLCVVGDDDQSIYKFRGATIENILSFEDQFPGARVIRLEQNYRSTGNILGAANGVIANNTERKGKQLWTSAEHGEKVRILRVSDEEAESRLIANMVMDHVSAGGKFSDWAVLYRINAQSNSVERALAQNAIPYRVVGGLRFYERKEIKDMISYLTVLTNPGDNLRLSRVFNEPKRGLGATTLSSAREIADTIGISLFETLKNCEQYVSLSKKSTSILKFTSLIESLSALSEHLTLPELLDAVLDNSGYRAMLESQGFEGAGRLENILELKTNLIRYQEQSEDPSLSGFLEDIALYTDLDSYDPGADSMVLMTVHSAKGLEFPHVVVAGMDEGIFPGRAAMNFPAEIEEERRLAYVAITRAKNTLTVTTARRRMIFGQTIYGNPSRFIGEIPHEFAALDDRTVRVNASAAATRGTRPTRVGAAKSLSAVQIHAGVASGIGIGAGSKPTQSAEAFAAGDRIRHPVFGDGAVRSTKPMGGDLLLEIDFERSGSKKIMANFARLVKL